MDGSWGQNLQDDLNIDKQIVIILHFYYVLTGIDHVLDIARVI